MTERCCADPRCGNPLVQRKGESRGDYEKRRFCSRSCRAPGRAPPYCRCGKECAAQGRSKYAVTCGDPKCITAMRNPVLRAGWPRITGEIAWNGAFARHNLRINDGGPLLIARPSVARSPSLSTAAWLLREAV